MSTIKTCLAAALLVPLSFAQAPSDERIREILADRIDTQKRSVGIAVGVIDSEGRRVVTHGRLSAAQDASAVQSPLDGDTIFEIGSVTKVFTVLVLADMVERGEVRFDDPVSDYLPEAVTLPAEITLDSLASHMSGLPRLPTNLSPADRLNPYKDYLVEDMYEFLSGFEPTRGVGETYEYSNLGGALLGHVLARRAGSNYETLISDRISGPLGMESTMITLPEEFRSRFATGHGRNLKPAPNWDLPTFAGAGALRSSVNDMLRFVAAALGPEQTPLTGAMKRLLEVRQSAGSPAMAIARGWHIFAGDPEVIWHNGGTGGYRSFVGFSPSSGVGVVVLSNSQVTVDDLGRHLLDPDVELMKAPRERTEITLEDSTLERYVGRYQLAPEFILTVTREGDRLFTQATGQRKAPIFAETKTKFFLKVVEAEIVFQLDENEQVSGLELHQAGQVMPAKRLDEAP